MTYRRHSSPELAAEGVNWVWLVLAPMHQTWSMLPSCAEQAQQARNKGQLSTTDGYSQWP